jgi:flagellar basal-body rod modification protein FlgD
MPDPITPTTATSTAPAPRSETQSAFKASSDMFLKLMVENLKHQDPMKPQDSDAYVQQIAQMSTVEQLTDLTNSQKRTETLALLGRQVSFRDASTPPRAP